MHEKCFFCEHDRGPLAERSEKCDMCCNCNEFQLKTRLTPTALYEYEKLIHEQEWINDKTIEFDRDTAVMVLKALVKHMHPSTDLFGNKTLVIDRNRFEAVRKKFLG